MVTYAKISPKNGEPQRYSWGTQKKKKNLEGQIYPNWMSSCRVSLSELSSSCTKLGKAVLTRKSHLIRSVHESGMLLSTKTDTRVSTGSFVLSTQVLSI